MKYVITRIATRNPDINGRVLYWTHIGLWSLDMRNARTFERRSEAEEQLVKDLEGCRVVEL